MLHSSKSVAVIGAGISGIVTAAHLKNEGIDVTVFERSSAAGGIWYVIQWLAILGLNCKGSMMNENPSNLHIHLYHHQRLGAPTRNKMLRPQS
jgi:cation diffusion facilitator CzcD-associated flavoprotein CzcO